MMKISAATSILLSTSTTSIPLASAAKFKDGSLGGEWGRLLSQHNIGKSQQRHKEIDRQQHSLFRALADMGDMSMSMSMNYAFGGGLESSSEAADSSESADSIETVDVEETVGATDDALDSKSGKTGAPTMYEMSMPASKSGKSSKTKSSKGLDRCVFENPVINQIEQVGFYSGTLANIGPGSCRGAQGDDASYFGLRFNSSLLEDRDPENVVGACSFNCLELLYGGKTDSLRGFDVSTEEGNECICLFDEKPDLDDIPDDVFEDVPGMGGKGPVTYSVSVDENDEEYERACAGVTIFECDLLTPKFLQVDIQDAIWHGNMTNNIIASITEDWVAGNITATDVVEVGNQAGVAHMDALICNRGEDVKNQLCAMLLGLSTQMENTCFYNQYAEAYANVAANFMYGMGVGLQLYVLPLEECTYEGGVTYGEVYGDLLTDETKSIIQQS